MTIFVRSQEIEHAVGPGGRFSLRVTAPDVELHAVPGANARVRVEFELRAATEADADDLFERVKFRARHGEGFLEVTEPKHGDSAIGGIARILGMGNAKIETSIVAEVPAGVELAYDGVSGDVTSTGFTGGQEYRTVSGDLVLDRLAGNVRVRGVSSDISLRADEPLRLEMNTVSGDVSAVAPRFEELRIVTVSGDVEVEGDLAPEPQHRVETVSGDLSLGIVGGVTLEVRGLSSDTHISVPHRSEGSRDRRRYVIGDGEANLLFSSMSGDLLAGTSRRMSDRHGAPRPPTAPTPPTPPSPPTPPTQPRPAVNADEQLRILQALERGEIDVDEASARLAGRKTDA